MAAPLYSPELMGLCIVNGLAVGAVCGGHVAAGCSGELMLKDLMMINTALLVFSCYDDR